MRIMLEQPPFDYMHNGQAKVGYYDPIAEILVATVGEAITSVITHATPAYIERLKNGELV